MMACQTRKLLSHKFDLGRQDLLPQDLLYVSPSSNSEMVLPEKYPKSSSPIVGLLDKNNKQTITQY